MPFRSSLAQLLVAILCCVIVVITAAARWSQRRHTTESLQTLRKLAAAVPRQQRDKDYVSSKRCQTCHPREYESWHKTFHRTMTQVATPDNVVADFDGSTVLVNGLEYRVYRQDDEFWAEMPDPDVMMKAVLGGKQIDELTFLIKRDKNSPLEQLDLRDIPRVQRQVVMTTGSHHYQTYWVPGGDEFGRLLQTLPLIYLIKDRRWIPREAAFMHPPEATHLITQWNHHCIRCHSTGGNPNLDPTDGRRFDTEVGELGIACEACHGPAEQHVRAHQNPLNRYQARLADDDDLLVNPEKLDHRKSSQVCGQCHGVFIHRRGEPGNKQQDFGMRYAFEGILFRPGQDLNKTRHYIQFPTNGNTSAAQQRAIDSNREFYAHRWWPDGTILAGGREYTALVKTGCYQRGTLSCLSCHQMHGDDPVDQLKAEMRSAAACIQCHDDPEYTTLVEQHTHHKRNSAGSNCLNCHMARTSYALLGALRSHQITSPNAAQSLVHGTPNACNLCHLDQSVAWTQETLYNWYGHDRLPLTPADENTAAALQWLLSGDAAQRVIAAWHFGWPEAHQASGNQWQAPFLSHLLSDPYGVVRYVAAQSLRNLPGLGSTEIDFLAGDERLRDLAQQVRDNWQEALPTDFKSPGSQVLMDGLGLDQQRIDQLLSQRNDRPVTIKE